MRVKIQRTMDVPLPEYQTEGAAGFDLGVAFGTEVRMGMVTLASTGLIIATPPEHMLLVAPRSSTFKKWGVTLANTVGIVDSDYCGPDDEVKLALTVPFNTGSAVVW